MRDVFENPNIDNTCSQENCDDWDSLHHLNLVSELEDEFDVEFEPEEISQMKSYDKIFSILSKKMK
jgi:acyl carrier protein